jgi:hydrogenase maturation protein HypF
MTSGNLSGNRSPRQRRGARLPGTLADAFLHNRDIDQRCDDSVVLTPFARDRRHARRIFLRRARGAAPYPVRLPYDSPPTLALGGELKNTFCLARERSAFLSQHIGDMENVQTLESFERTLALLRPLFRVEPQIVAHDMHPDYLTTRWANDHRSESHQTIAVQHHHAHICSCMVENGVAPGERVLGLAFDGTGYGSDGAIWGGEVLLASYAGFERLAHLEYWPLAGGDAAIREPWKILAGYGEALDLNLEGARLSTSRPHCHPARWSGAKSTPPTAGAALDAAAVIAATPLPAAMAAAIQFGAARAGRGDARRDLPAPRRDGDRVLVVRDAGAMPRHAGASEGEISLRFHHSLASSLGDLLRELGDETGVRGVALSGGVWQNTLLLELVVQEIIHCGLRPLLHRQIPPNDGGLALGQAAAAAHRAGG